MYKVRMTASLKEKFNECKKQFPFIDNFKEEKEYACSCNGKNVCSKCLKAEEEFYKDED